MRHTDVYFLTCCKSNLVHIYIHAYPNTYMHTYYIHTYILYTHTHTASHI